MSSTLRIITIVALLSTLAACGQTGYLYLPGTTPTIAQDADVTQTATGYSTINDSSATSSGTPEVTPS